MKKYYHIRSFFKNDPITIIELNEEAETMLSVYSLMSGEITKYDIVGDLFISQIKQIPELEQCLVTDEKNKELINEKLVSIYNVIKKKIRNPKNVYYLPRQETETIEKQIEDAIEFIKTKGLSLKEKIDYKKQELLAIALELKKIKKRNRKILSKYCILSIITALITVFSIKELIEELPYLLQVLSSAMIPSSLFIISNIYVQNKDRKESQSLLEQYDLEKSYLEKYIERQISTQLKQTIKLHKSEENKPQLKKLTPVDKGKLYEELVKSKINLEVPQQINREGFELKKNELLERLKSAKQQLIEDSQSQTQEIQKRKRIIRK